jgi:hypothetical protein
MGSMGTVPSPSTLQPGLKQISQRSPTGSAKKAWKPPKSARCGGLRTVAQALAASSSMALIAADVVRQRERLSSRPGARQAGFDVRFER